MTTDTLHGMLERWRAKVKPLACGNTAAAGCVQICVDEAQPIADQLQAVVERMPHSYDFGGAVSPVAQMMFSPESVKHKEDCEKCQLQRILGTKNS